jgi:formylglycine-generating enzyme required for sulfatase activity
LLKAFENAGKQVDYYALDLSLPELERTFSEVSTNQYAHVSLHALHGTYEDGIAWLREPQNQDKPTCVMTLGSSLGNFTREEAATFLASIAAVLLPGDSILVGLDACQDPERVFRAYNDSKGITEKFYRNGLDHANRLLGKKIFAQEDWKIEGMYNEEVGRHEASYTSLKDISAGNLVFRKGDKLYLESAYKYTSKQSESLWRSAGLISQAVYGRSDYRMSYLPKRPLHEKSLMMIADVHLITPSRIGFEAHPNPSQYAEKPLPSERDWQQLWTAWDTVTRAMLPSKDELLTKPIKLRNDLIFYLGHIPAFADIHFTKATGAPPTHPAYYHSIFERGIDPDVDNPEICHDHSEIPDTWPPLEEMLEYQARVRTRFLAAIKSGEASTDRKLTRSIWLSYEHEAMHLETFLYMLLQSEQVLPPPGHATPDFKSMALEAREKRSSSKWHRIPRAEVVVGLDDPENDDGPDRFFGWDNERPSRIVQVGSFEAQNRPISNGEYARYLQESGFEMLPSSWITKGQDGECANGVLRDITNEGIPKKSFTAGKSIRTVFGLVPLEYALDWPVMASYDELASFAKWAGGRIPSYEEAKSIHQYAEMRKADAVNINSSLISAVNG